MYALLVFKAIPHTKNFKSSYCTYLKQFLANCCKKLEIIF